MLTSLIANAGRALGPNKSRCMKGALGQAVLQVDAKPQRRGPATSCAVSRAYRPGMREQFHHPTTHDADPLGNRPSRPRLLIATQPCCLFRHLLRRGGRECEVGVASARITDRDISVPNVSHTGYFPAVAMKSWMRAPRVSSGEPTANTGERWLWQASQCIRGKRLRAAVNAAVSSAACF
jgi:hypothetical protein